MDIQIGQLRAFVVAAREKSFTRAAEVLSVTQPSVTARIQTLENEMRIPLFLRKGRSIALTEGGKVFLPFAERALSVLDEGAEAVRNVREGTAGRFSVGAITTICLHLIAPLLESFHQTLPNVEIFLRSGPTPQIIDMLLDDVVQIGVAVGPVVHTHVQTLHVHRDEMIVVASPEHPFAASLETKGKAGAVQSEMLAGEEFVVVRWGSAFDLFMGRLSDVSRTPRISMEIGVTDTAKAMVKARAGLCVLPRFAVSADLQSGNLIEVPVADIPPTFLEICVIHRRDRQLSQSTQAFLDLWKSYMANYNKTLAIQD
jgi:DNA-binding transcriptional LysR family regulator